MDDRGLEHTDVGALALSTFSVPDSMPESLGESNFLKRGCGLDTGVIVSPLCIKCEVAVNSSSPEEVEPEFALCLCGHKPPANVAAKRGALEALGLTWCGGAGW
uniref:Uncharacterized protein n=1 Tax=Photinus pyralis TaxID=7054 RepID=A0A1Y1JQV5_PHOPY